MKNRLIQIFYYSFKSTVVLLYTLLLILLLPFSGITQSLQEYVQIALDNNPDIRSKSLQYESALQKIPQKGALPDPEIGAQYFLRSTETRVGPQQASFSASQMFPWFGTLETREKVAEEKAKVQYYKYLSSRDQLILNVKQQYYQLYLIKEKIALQKKNLELLRSFESLALERYEAGNTSMTDVLRSQMRINDAENQLSITKNKKNTQITHFNKLLNRNARDSVNISDTLEIEEKLWSLDSALQKNPRVLLRQASWSAAKHQVRNAELSGKPRMGIGFNYIMVGKRTGREMPDNGKDIWAPQLKLSVPLFRKQYKAREEGARMKMESENYQKKQLLNKIESRFVRQKNKYKDAKRSVKHYHDQVSKASQARDLLITRYTAGKENIEEVLRMQQKVLEYKKNLEKAIKKLHMAEAYLNFLTSYKLND